jgi:hypothetical protein
MDQNVSMAQWDCCSAVNVRLVPPGFCLKRNGYLLLIMLEKQSYSGKIDRLPSEA